MKFIKILILITLIAVVILCSSCSPLCDNEIIKTVPSPDGKYKVIAFFRDCGATTSFSPQVSVLEINKKFTEENVGNVFVGNKSQYIDTYWLNDNTLVVKYDCTEDNIFKQEKAINGITIVYEKK